MPWLKLTSEIGVEIIVNMDNVLRAVPRDDGTSHLVTMARSGESTRTMNVRESVDQIVSKLFAVGEKVS